MGSLDVEFCLVLVKVSVLGQIDARNILVLPVFGLALFALRVVSRDDRDLKRWVLLSLHHEIPQIDTETRVEILGACIEDVVVEATAFHDRAPRSH